MDKLTFKLIPSGLINNKGKIMEWTSQRATLLAPTSDGWRETKVFQRYSQLNTCAFTRESLLAACHA